MAYPTAGAGRSPSQIGGITGPSETSVREPHIVKAMHSLESHVTDIGDALKALDARLGPILRSPEPSDANKAMRPDTGVKLVDAISEQCDRLASYRAVLDDLLTRLEI